MGHPRPGPLNLADLNNELPRPPRRNYHVDLPSPRAGEIPPALSPLDAFAAQSRMLAKRFEEQREDGRRISRLPHTDVAREFASRPGYFSSVSEENTHIMDDVPELNEDLAPTRPTTNKGVADGKESERPKSQYPVFGHAKKPSAGQGSLPGTPFFEAPEFPRFDGHPRPQQDYFGAAIPRASSPEQVESRFVSIEAPSPNVPSLTNSVDTVQSSKPRKATSDSQNSQQSQHSQHSQLSQLSIRSDRGLAPPASPRFPRSPRSAHSIRSVRQDSGDDESSLSGFAVTSQRKFSGSSVSRPQSPFSPTMPPMHRSPSMSSEYSMTGAQFAMQRPPFANFSRPISAAGQSRRSMDTRPSLDSLPNDVRPFVENDARSIASESTHSVSKLEVSRHSEVQTPQTNTAGFNSPATETFDANGTSSYTYAKFTLPRGRVVERDSAGPRSSWQAHQFSWEQSRESETRRPLTSTQEKDEESHVLQPPRAFAFDESVRPTTSSSLQPHDERPARAHETVASSDRSRSAEQGARVHRSTASVNTESTDRTIRATPLHQRSVSSELTPEENLEIGIHAHDRGQLNKSTYHLRLAAMAGLPTAMLLYALACRHGWGMRPNQKDGVMWLQKAIDSSQLELSLEQDLPAGTGDPAAAAVERRKRKAQYALAVYELGISYAKGWGCDKDKPLALKCFELAGSWGDTDALAEAGYCYTEGVGCKKDLKKAARLYRRAADLGMSMTGNSWIYKDKYMDEKPAKAQDKDKKQPPAAPTDKDTQEKPAGRQRSRSLWGRKKDKDKPAGAP